MKYTAGSVADLSNGKGKVVGNKGKISKKNIKNTRFDSKLDSESYVSPIVKGGKKKINKKKAKKDDTVVLIPEAIKTLDEEESGEESPEFDDEIEFGKSENEIESGESNDEIESGESGKTEDEIELKPNLTKFVSPVKEKHRTVFVENVPADTTEVMLRKLFERFGSIQSIRIWDSKPKNSLTNRRAGAIKKLLHPKQNNMLAYIVYDKREDALKSLKLNSFKYYDQHLRVVEAYTFKKPPAEKAIFIGQLDLEAEDKDLWETFESCGSIESVRLVPNKFGGRTVTGYVNFNSSDSVELALKMQDVKIKKSICRISRFKSPKNKIGQPNKKLEESQIAEKTIFIGQLDSEADNQDLLDAFKSCGTITSVKVVRDKSGAGTGIGYVNFNSADSVELALQMGNVKIKNKDSNIRRYYKKLNNNIRKPNKFLGNKMTAFKKFKNFPKTGKNITNLKTFQKVPKTKKNVTNLNEVQELPKIENTVSKKKFQPENGVTNLKKSEKSPSIQKNKTNGKKTVYGGRVAKISEKKKIHKDMSQKLKQVVKIAPKVEAT